MSGTSSNSVSSAAEEALAEQRYVSAIDVLLGLRWLVPPHLDEWHQASELSAVVVRFSRSRTRYERQGFLVEAAAPAQAQRSHAETE